MGLIGFKKMLFVLQPNEAGWPPVGVEGVWATPVPTVEAGELLCVLDSIPFYATAAVGDCFRVVEHEGELYASELVSESGHGTVRVVGDGTVLEAIREFAISCGCQVERTEGMLALDVPPAADWARLQQELADAETRGDLEYEEAVLPRRS